MNLDTAVQVEHADRALGAAVAVTLVGITLLVVAVYNRFLEASTGAYQRHAG